MDSISDIAHEAFIYGLPTVDLYRILVTTSRSTPPRRSSRRR